MKTTSLLPGLLLGLFLGGCHPPIKDRVRLPVAPVPIAESSTAATPVESKTTAVESASSSTPETSSSPGRESAPVKYSLKELLLELGDAYFDLDRHDLREDARGALRSDASVLRSIAAQAPGTRMVVEGHCDERGSAEYNLALGARRAEAAQKFLVELGVPVATLKTITYGKERPQCTSQTEECWQKNRRAHLAPGQ
jgi:peptidoglycan-associated lipoprotein